jgi:hypothetical protein
MLFFPGRYPLTISSRAMRKAADAESKTRGLDSRVADLEKRTDRLGLVCQALWELLRERTGMTEDEVLQRMHEIDLRDGVEDGRISGTKVQCESCGSTCNSAAARCIYCGHPLPTSSLVR